MDEVVVIGYGTQRKGDVTSSVAVSYTHLLHPRFVRFPGGCVAHGDGVDNMYDWKGSIGALEERKPLRNLWGYHQTVSYTHLEVGVDFNGNSPGALLQGIDYSTYPVPRTFTFGLNINF